MTELQQKQLQFLTETIEHYSPSPYTLRCTTETGICKYQPTETSRGCAIGRHLPLYLAQEFDTYANASVSTCKIFDQLPQNLKELTQQFLTMVQNLHDVKSNWSVDGLSREGIIVVNTIKTMIGL
jgi:hypothetical protein